MDCQVQDQTGGRQNSLTTISTLFPPRLFIPHQYTCCNQTGVCSKLFEMTMNHSLFSEKNQEQNNVQDGRHYHRPKR